MLRHCPAALLLLILMGCRTLVITPAALQELENDAAREALDKWKEAVVLINEFLASPYNLTLPKGRFKLDTAEGMVFWSDDGTYPIRVESTTWGDLTVWSGFRAQERSFGFVVGSRPPDEEPLLDHSLFRVKEGSWDSPKYIAELILHETSHVVHREGTIGFWNAVAYYLEAVFLFRARTHSAENRPRATSEEFLYFFLSRERDGKNAAIAWKVFQGHIGTEHDHCEHGLRR